MESRKKLKLDIESLIDKSIITKAGMAKKAGIGNNPAVVVIDAQNYMVGIDENGDNSDFPSSCGEIGWSALRKINKFLGICRGYNIPIFYSRMALDPSGKDIGYYGKKRDFLDNENWMIDGTIGAEISNIVKPKSEDFVFVKKKPSAFFNTPLISYLMELNIDTLYITGGSTSNCVRATVFDSSSYNLNTVVIEDCVFDRIQLSHEVSLFDMNRQFADVVSLEEAVKQIENLSIQHSNSNNLDKENYENEDNSIKINTSN